MHCVIHALMMNTEKFRFRFYPLHCWSMWEYVRACSLYVCVFVCASYHISSQAGRKENDRRQQHQTSWIRCDRVIQFSMCTNFTKLNGAEWVPHLCKWEREWALPVNRLPSSPSLLPPQIVQFSQQHPVLASNVCVCSKQRIRSYLSGLIL